MGGRATYNLSFNPNATNRLILCNAKEALTFVMKNYTTGPCQTWSKYAIKRLNRRDNDNSNDVNGSKEEGTVEEFSDPRMYIDGDTDENGEDEDLYDKERGNDENEDVTCDAFCSLDDSKSKDRKTCFSSIHDGEKGCFHKLCFVCE